MLIYIHYQFIERAIGTIFIWKCVSCRVNHYPESGEVGGVVAETSQETGWSISFRAASGAPVLEIIVPENTGKVVQRCSIHLLKQQHTHHAWSFQTQLFISEREVMFQLCPGLVLCVLITNRLRCLWAIKLVSKILCEVVHMHSGVIVVCPTTQVLQFGSHCKSCWHRKLKMGLWYTYTFEWDGLERRILMLYHDAWSKSEKKIKIMYLFHIIKDGFSYYWFEQHLHMWHHPGSLTPDVAREDSDGDPLFFVPPWREEAVILVEDETQRNIGELLTTSGTSFVTDRLGECCVVLVQWFASESYTNLINWFKCFTFWELYKNQGLRWGYILNCRCVGVEPNSVCSEIERTS